MLWNEFYDQYLDWINETIRHKISCLENIGSGDEIVDVILEVEDPQIREILIKRSMNMKAQFTIDNFQDLLDELPASLYEQLGYYTGYDHNDPFFDEDNMEWDDFYTYYGDWREDVLLRRIQKLKMFGSSDELHEVLENIKDPELKKMLYNRAVAVGVNCSLDISWDAFYEKFDDWSDAVKEKRITCLRNIGCSDEIVDIILQTDNMAIRELLIHKAMQMNAVFTLSDFQWLDNMLTDDLYRQLGEYTGFDHENPYFDEDNMEWDDFYWGYEEWSPEILQRRVHKLKDFGPSDQVCEVILDMEDSDLGELLYEGAVNTGVRFTQEELESLGMEPEESIMSMDETLESNFSQEAKDDFVAAAESLVAEFEAQERKQRRTARLGIVMGILSAFAASGRKKDTGRCDGDCDHCPAHYGYRYGRWYYGHGHQSGCQRGGNGGAHGRTYRD